MNMKTRKKFLGAIAGIGVLVACSRVVAQPVALTIQASNGLVSVSWPAGLSLVQPQLATNLASGSWRDYGAATTASNLNEAAGAGPTYYRLRFLGPNIVNGPQSQTNATGSNATFTVTATGTAPLQYQWQRAGTNLDGSTATTLMLANLVTGDAGSYRVIVTNWVGSVTSAVATLTVTNLPARPVGIYMGTFAGEVDNGGFAAMVRSNGTAYVVGYNGLQDDGVLAQNFPVAINGVFYTTTTQSGKVGGTFTDSAVSGNFTNSVGQTGTFSGNRKSDTGIHAADVGYYSGSYNGYKTGSAYMIVAADGTAFFFTTDSSGDGGGYGTVSAGNSFSATTVPDSLTVTGTLSQATHVLSGSYFSGTTKLGNFSVSRTLTP
jgi:hypothetical protein